MCFLLEILKYSPIFPNSLSNTNTLKGFCKLVKSVLLGFSKAALIFHSLLDVKLRLDSLFLSQIYGNYYEKTRFQKVYETLTHPKMPNLEYDMKYKDFHRERFDTGDWTDDSDQMILILLSLVENSGKVRLCSQMFITRTPY